jgi:hypothetical protein
VVVEADSSSVTVWTYKYIGLLRLRKNTEGGPKIAL